MIRLPTPRPCEPIGRTSATVSAVLSECMYRAGQELVAETQRLFAASPAALIGILAHKVIEGAHTFPVEKARALATQAERSSASAALWADAERDLLAASRVAGRLRRPREWPHYAMKRARAIALAGQIIGDRGSGEAEGLEVLLEEECEACDGKLVGRIDRAFKTPDGWVIEDLKTGRIRDASGAPLPQYRRQLLIYAFLLREVVGEWPRIVRLVPLTGPPYEEPLDPNEAADAVRRSLAELREYNDLVAQHPDDTHTQMEALANPDPQTCAWCHVRAWCEPYWTMRARLDGDAGTRSDIQGSLETAWHHGEAMKLRPDRAARTITLGIHPSHLETAPRYLARGTFIRAIYVRVQRDTGIGQADLSSEIWWRH